MLNRMNIGWFMVFLGLAVAVQAQDRSKILAYETTKAPVIDGKISAGEWDAAGPPIVVRADSPNAIMINHIDEDPYGGPDDISYQFRVMWISPFMVYFLYEVTDDIAMLEDPVGLWDRDQVETFIDGNELEGNEDAASFHYWSADEPYGKFGVDRNGNFEGNTAKMSALIEDIAYSDEKSFICAVGAAGPWVPAQKTNYIVELAIYLEPMWYLGVLETDKIEAGKTKVKMTVNLSDDDNFKGAEDVQRSTSLVYYREDQAGNEGTWDQSSFFPDLTFVGPYAEVQNWSVY